MGVDFVNNLVIFCYLGRQTSSAFTIEAGLIQILLMITPDSSLTRLVPTLRGDVTYMLRPDDLYEITLDSRPFSYRTHSTCFYVTTPENSLCTRNWTNCCLEILSKIALCFEYLTMKHLTSDSLKCDPSWWNQSVPAFQSFLFTGSHPCLVPAGTLLSRNSEPPPSTSVTPGSQARAPKLYSICHFSFIILSKFHIILKRLSISCRRIICLCDYLKIVDSGIAGNNWWICLNTHQWPERNCRVLYFFIWGTYYKK